MATCVLETQQRARQPHELFQGDFARIVSPCMSWSVGDLVFIGVNHVHNLTRDENRHEDYCGVLVEPLAIGDTLTIKV